MNNEYNDDNNNNNNKYDNNNNNNNNEADSYYPSYLKENNNNNLNKNNIGLKGIDTHLEMMENIKKHKKTWNIIAVPLVVNEKNEENKNYNDNNEDKINDQKNVLFHKLPSSFEDFEEKKLLKNFNNIFLSAPHMELNFNEFKQCFFIIIIILLFIYYLLFILIYLFFNDYYLVFLYYYFFYFFIATVVITFIACIYK
jgi:hypothetical protein